MGLIRIGAVAGACCAAIIGIGPVVAQNIAPIVGPAEVPPADFSGQQYVDSRGCVFMRAGFGGQVNWVPRIGRDRKPVCNMVTPAQAVARLAQGDAAAAAGDQAGQGADVARPRKTALSGSAMGAAPMPAAGLSPRAVMLNLQTGVATVETVGSAPAANPVPKAAAASLCPAEVPVLQYFPVATGGEVAVCTRGDGTPNGWRSPRLTAVGGAFREVGAQGGGLTVAGGAAPMATQTDGLGGSIFVGGSDYRLAQPYVQTVVAGQPVVAMPQAVPAYSPAWKDDRLNPLRGIGAQPGAAGPAGIGSDASETRTVAQPATLHGADSFGSGADGQRMVARPALGDAQNRLTGAGIYVQVGVFGQPANAQRTAGLLANMGLPVARANSLKAGGALVAIMAGPFASAPEAQSALGMVRGAGFGDAYIR